MEAAQGRMDNLTWFQAPLINSSSDKATALTTSVVAEGLYFLKLLQLVKGKKKKTIYIPCGVCISAFISLKTFKVFVIQAVNL